MPSLPSPSHPSPLQYTSLWISSPVPISNAMTTTRSCFSLLVLLAAVVFQGAAAAAVTCDKKELAPCAIAISKGVPSAACCTKLRELRPCVCEFLKDPVVRQIIQTPKAQKVIAACHLEPIIC
ncbi:hypothetical protein Taro_035594 [Colocasia esculenta]|uniref:Bifunctional inhibitor/plant lipid transfer protein/seed storage helical domain-containing protein n=1 Tax=Colocasia esculenta TaxID=4460 RepID=A0A843WFA2_COLES|nr:hypothetical protein [Colocasia esculenta]